MEFGKFNSAEELLKGYTELEKSFTQKCQQVAQLQKQMEGTSGQTPPSTTVADDETIPQSQSLVQTSAMPTEKQLQQFLESNPTLAFKLLQQNATPTSPTMISSGGTVSVALPSRPKTIREATLMAQQMFGK